MPLTVAEQLARGLIPKARSTLFARGSIYEQFAYAPLFWRPQMATVPRRLKRIEVYCPEYETTATIRINDAHSSGTDHLEVDYRSPDHSHFTIAIPDDWTDQDLLDLIFYHLAILHRGIGQLGKFPLTTSSHSSCSGSGKVRRSRTSELMFLSSLET